MKKINRITTLVWKKIIDKKNIVFFLVFLVFIFHIGTILSQRLLVTIPKKGGEINEIIINSKIRFINPILALSPADKDLVSLIYSPLVKINDQKKIVPNIASYKLGNDKKTYTIKIKDNVYFHDGAQLTADDVIFTIKEIQDPLIKSPYYSSWLGVEVKKINNLELEIKLKNEYYQFVNSLMLYILPKHLWEKVAPEEFPFSKFNIKPIGSGPFLVENVNRNESGEIEKFTLRSFKDYFKKEAFLDNITFNFFNSLQEYKESLLSKNQDSYDESFFSDSSEIIKKILPKDKIIKLETPKIFGLFIQAYKKNKYLSNNKLRELLKESLLKDIQKTDFEKLEGFSYSDSGELLFDKLQVSFVLTFFQDEKLENIAKRIKKKFGDIGIKVNLEKIDNTKKLENIIRDRNFETIIFGYNPGIIKDLFYFFHSSQINDPGANIAGIKNKNIDKLLIELRKNMSPKDRDEKLLKIKKELDSSNLFIPFYSSQEFYKIPTNLKNFNKKIINSRENRFDDVENWYLKEERILPFLKNK